MKHKIVILNPYGSFKRNSIAKGAQLYVEIFNKHYDTVILSYDLEQRSKNHISLYSKTDFLPNVLFSFFKYIPHKTKFILKKKFYTTRLDFILYWLYVKKYLYKNKNVDLIIVLGNPIFLKLLRNIDSKIKILFHSRNKDLDIFDSVESEEILSISSQVICINKPAFEKAISKNNKFNVWYIPNCINEIKEIDCSNINSDKVIFLYTGRIVREKFILELCESFQCLYKDNINYELKIAGVFFDAKYERDFYELIDGSPNINYLGFLDEMELNKVYKESDYVILLSESEGSPNCLLEGISNNCRLIASNIPGCNEIISAFGGYLVDMSDLEASLRSIFLDIENKRYMLKLPPCEQNQSQFTRASFKNRIHNVLDYILPSKF